MFPFLIVYASRDGHSFRIADHIADGLRERQLQVRVKWASSWDGADLAQHSGVLLISPVHAGMHAPELVEFAKKHRLELARMPSLMLSVSLAQAGVEGRWTRAARAKAGWYVRDSIARFCAETEFSQARVIPVAGALSYSRYGIVKRMFMKRLARLVGADADTSRDWDYTNWRRIYELIEELARAQGHGMPAGSAKQASEERLRASIGLQSARSASAP